MSKKRHQKSRNIKTKPRKKTPKPTKHPNKGELVFLEYEITDEPIDKTDAPIPKEEIKHLYFLVFNEPKEAIKKLGELIKKYPDFPVLYNYLANAYQTTGQLVESYKVAKENYLRNPDYLFAKLNYARICVHHGELDKIPEIFDNKFDLKLLYPHRNQFHISEYVGFAHIMALYFWEKGDRNTAHLYYNNLKEIAPDHPSTKEVKKIMNPPLKVKMLDGIISYLEGKTQNT